MKIALCQGAGFVEHGHAHLCGFLDCFTALGMYAFSSQSAAAAPEYKRNGNSERCRTAYCKERQCTIYPALKRGRRVEQRRYDRKQYSQDKHEGNETRYHKQHTAFQCCLMFAAVFLHAHNTADCAVIEANHSPHQQKRAGIQAARQHVRILADGCELAVARNNALINSALAADHNAVKRYTLS